MKKTFTLIVFLNVLFFSQAQLVRENFKYSTGGLTLLANGTGQNVSNGAWTNISSSTFPIQVVAGSLSYPGYAQSDTANKVRLQAAYSSAEDAAIDFTPVPPGASSTTIYYSFLLNLIDTAGICQDNDTTGNYFINLVQPGSTSVFHARVSAKKAVGQNAYQLGIRTNSAVGFYVTYAPDILLPGTTYYIVVGMEMVPGATNDKSYLWINPAFSLTPPTPNATSLWPTSVSESATGYGRLLLRQGFTNASGSSQRSANPNCDIDGIVVSTLWAEVTLPIGSLEFDGGVLNGKVNLKWTATDEVNVKGYSVERSLNGKDFQAIDLISAKNGAKNNYELIDGKAVNGVNYYRLKVIDKDGKFTYSKVLKFQLSKPDVISIYPNPVSSVVSIAHPATTKGAFFRLLNNEGKLIMSLPIAQGATRSTLNVAALPTGNYFVEFINDGQKTISKLNKQ